MTALDALVLVAALAGTTLASLRWWRVAQREHYLAGSVGRFAHRWWWQAGARNRLLAVAALVGVVAAVVFPPGALLTAVAVGLGPLGLALRGRTSRLAWTRRLGLVAAATVLLEAGLVVLGAVSGGLRGAVFAAALGALGVPVVVDLALALLRPLEDALAGRYVRSAEAKLELVDPVVIGVTGSYGKTSTKNYIAHLLAGERAVVASPRSFNNRAGLARTVNEHVEAGTELLVAEMGAYGPGEIARLCAWLHPKLSVITAIGPAHLERYGTLERTLAAKAEITRGAEVVVLNVDDDYLARLAVELAGADPAPRVVGASGSDGGADVAVLSDGAGLALWVGGRPVGKVAMAGEGALPISSNVACAAAVALEFDVAPDEVLRRLASLPGVPNRLQRYLADAGYVVLDDTFNANPAGARVALDLLASEPATGRRVLVTPGMVELGRSQVAENAALAEAAATVVSDLVVVAATNRPALVAGAARAARPPAVEVVATREEAVSWARRHLGPGDVVLFENDLPDHFP